MNLCFPGSSSYFLVTFQCHITYIFVITAIPHCKVLILILFSIGYSAVTSRPRNYNSANNSLRWMFLICKQLSSSQRSIFFWLHYLLCSLSSHPAGRGSSMEAWREHLYLLKSLASEWYIILLFISGTWSHHTAKEAMKCNLAVC